MNPGHHSRTFILQKEGIERQPGESFCEKKSFSNNQTLNIDGQGGRNNTSKINENKAIGIAKKTTNACKEVGGRRNALQLNLRELAMGGV